MLHAALWHENLDLAEACWRHPFVLGLKEGTLEVTAFRRYVAQDRAYLHAFARAYALAAARSRDQETLLTFCELLNGVWKELELHAVYARRLNIDLTQFQLHRATRAYADFLLATAWHRDLDVIVAAMTPCMRLYAYLGGELARGVKADNPYREWVATYSAPEFRALAERLENLLDRLANDISAVRDAYRYAMHCELNFFSAMMEDSA